MGQSWHLRAVSHRVHSKLRLMLCLTVEKGPAKEKNRLSLRPFLVVDRCAPFQGFQYPNQRENWPHRAQAGDEDCANGQARLQHKVADTSGEQHNGVDLVC